MGGYEVHSLAAHRKKIKDNAANSSQKSLASRPAPTIKKEADPKNIFSKQDDSDDSTSSSDDSSDDEDGTDFMKKIQQKKIKNGAPATNKRLSKDDEIADSDVERQASAKKTKQGGGAPLKPKPASTSTSEDESDSEEAEAKPKPQANGVKTNEDTSSSDSSDDDSEASSEDEAEGPIEKAAKQPEEPKAVESDAETDSTSEESDSDDDEGEPAKTAKPEAAPMPNGTSTKNTTTDSTSAEDSSSAGSSSDEEEQADVSMHIADRETDKGIGAPAVMAPDFMIRKSDQGLDGKDVAKVCSQANLEGKQLWYFTVPSNVPVSVVQNLEIQMDSAQRGDSVFSHDGEDYGISFNSGITKSTIQILVPSANGPEYRSGMLLNPSAVDEQLLTAPANRQIDQVMQVKRLPQIASSSSQAATQPAPPTAARPQPEGLRARYKPIGVYDPAPQTPQGQEDVEMTEAPAQPSSSKREKKATKAAAKAEKKASKDKSKKGGDIVEVPSSQKDSQESNDAATLKRKITSSEEDAELAAEQLMGESNAAANKRKKQKTVRTGSPELGSESAPSKKETSVVPPVETTTPAKKSKKEKKDKKDKKATTTPATNPMSAPESSTLKKQTPVPLPKFPGSSQIGVDKIPSSQPTPTVKKEKSKKSKKGTSAAVATEERKESPVPLPQQGASN